MRKGERSAAGGIVGYTDGVYDLFHVGHLRMIEAARKRCDYLIVGVHSDAVVESYKHRTPIIGEAERREIVAGLRAVDRAVINTTRDKLELWKMYHFDVVFIGDDWKGTQRWNDFERLLAQVGVRVEYLPYTKGISTTQLRQRIKETDE